MATYIYETIEPTQPLRRFEFQQTIKVSPPSHPPGTCECGRGACPRCMD
jgi:hypothetical protein